MKEMTIKRKNVKYLWIDCKKVCNVDKNTVMGIMKDGTVVTYHIVED